MVQAGQLRAKSVNSATHTSSLSPNALGFVQNWVKFHRGNKQKRNKQTRARLMTQSNCNTHSKRKTPHFSFSAIVSKTASSKCSAHTGDFRSTSQGLAHVQQQQGFQKGQNQAAVALSRTYLHLPRYNVSAANPFLNNTARMIFHFLKHGTDL